MTALDQDPGAVRKSIASLQQQSLNASAAASLFSHLESVWLKGRSEAWTRSLLLLSVELAEEHAAAKSMIVRMLEDPRPRVRQSALESAIAVEAVKNQRILPLIVSLHFGSGEDRYQSARLLGRFGVQAEPAAGALARAALDDSAHASVRWEAVYALRDVGPGGVEGLATVLGSSEKSVAYKTLEALTYLGDKAEPAYEAIAKSLASDDARIRHRAADCLGRMPLRAADSIPLLRQAADDPDQHVRDSVSRAIDHLTREPSRRRPSP